MSGPLRGYYVFKRRALGPHTFGTVVLLVLKKNPRFRDLLSTFRTATEWRFATVYGWKERVTVLLPTEF